MPEAQHILNRIKEAVIGLDPTADIILFGSRARGDHRPDSDWDVLIVTEKEISKTYEERLLQVLLDLQIELEVDVNYIVRRKNVWQESTGIPLDDEIKEEGISL